VAGRLALTALAKAGPRRRAAAGVDAARSSRCVFAGRPRSVVRTPPRRLLSLPAQTSGGDKGLEVLRCGCGVK
jgi:hypothetical protein